jgi:hypothetical protein
MTDRPQNRRFFVPIALLMAQRPPNILKKTGARVWHHQDANLTDMLFCRAGEELSKAPLILV